MKRGIRLYTMSALVGVLCALSAGVMRAQEIRTSYVMQNLSHDFDPRAMDTSIRYAVSGDYYSRTAHRAYTGHGFATDHLSSLFFNSSSFRLSHIFTDALVPRNTELYNPYVRVLTLEPRASYYEQGLTIGLGAVKEVLDGRAQVGVRVSLPIRSIEIEQKDRQSRNDRQTKDLVVRRAKVPNAAGQLQGSAAEAYRLDFLEALPQTLQGAGGIDYGSSTGTAVVKIFDKQVTGTGANLSPVVIASSEGHVLEGRDTGVRDASFANLPTSVSANVTSSDRTKKYVFAGNTSYEMYDDANAKTGAERIALQDQKAQLWVTTRHDSSGNVVTNSPSKAILDNATSIISGYNENNLEWLHDRGFDFESDRRVGLGDTDIEFFYGQEWGDRISFEVLLGLRVPTAGADNDFRNNPYTAHLGNGGHYESKLGGKISYEFNDIFCVSGSASYSYVFAAKEQIAGVALRSAVKGIGPREEATIRWGYFVGDIKLHAAHPRTRDLTGSVGYQLMVKGSDTIVYTNARTASWLGKLYDPTTFDYTLDNPLLLSGDDAAANTQRVAHILNMNLTYYVTDWIHLRCGAALTFAGKNAPQNTDFYGGFTVSV